MSFAFHGIVNVPAEEARASVEKTHAPQSIKDFVSAGIKGLTIKYGVDVKVSVTGQGHLCDDGQTYDVTSATLDVRKGD